MTTIQVQYVLEVARCLNISRAAKRLFVTQSALSQQIARLENELGYVLFQREAHGLQLTKEGKAFCRAAVPAIEAWTQFSQYAISLCASGQRSLRIVIGPRVYSNRLFADIVQYFDAHPNINVTFVTEAGRDFFADLKSGAIDLALDMLPFADDSEDNSSLYSCILVQERQCVLVSKDSPLAAKRTLSFQDLQGLPLISGLEDSAEEKTLREVCRRSGISLSRIYRSDGIETNVYLVRQGKGVMLGPLSFAEHYQIAAVPLTPVMETSLRFICLKSSLKRQEIRKFRDALLAVCSNRCLTHLQEKPDEGDRALDN